MAKPEDAPTNEDVAGASGNSMSEPPIQSTSSSLPNGSNHVANGTINLSIPSNFSGILHINRHHGVQNTEELQYEGRELFVDFLQGEFQSQQVNVPTEIQQYVSQEHTQRAPSNMARHGSVLRQLADEFAQSEGRQRVRNEANKVMQHIDHITAEEFQEFLSHFFVDDRNPWERIVTLFYFCSDMIITAVKKKLYDMTKKFIMWSIEFILKKVCDWVAKYGGWNAILGSMTKFTLNAISWIGVLAVASLAIVGGLYLWKNK